MKLHLKLVPGFADLFAGSDGTIWRYRNFSGKGARWNGWRQLAMQVHRDGYLEVTLPRVERPNRHLMVHTLVALAFHGERPTGLVITHRDGDRLNNRPANLAYRTTLDNVLDKIAHGTMLRGESHPRSKLTDEQCRTLLLRWSAGESQRALAAEFGVAESTLWSIRTGRTRAHLTAARH